MTARRRDAGGDRPGPWVAVVGTRPNYVKVAPLVRAAAAQGRTLLWIETGQHTNRALSRDMAQDLAMPDPVLRLRTRGQGTRRLAGLVADLEDAYADLDAGLVVVVGDVDSTLAAGVAAWRQDRPLVHVEAGLRSFEPSMPEERNRIAVDQMSDRLYVTEAAGAANLRAAGVARSRIRTPGNVMADALRAARPALTAVGSTLRDVPAGGFGLVTLHRQANVDEPARLRTWLRALQRVAERVPLVFPLHPRTRARLRAVGGRAALAGIDVRPPQSYLAFLALLERASLVITDSGGVQVEAALLRTPCVTARRSTEHPLTVERGMNRLTGTDARRLPRAVEAALSAGWPMGRTPRVWDGRAAQRIVADWCKGFRRPGRLPGTLGEAELGG